MEVVRKRKKNKRANKEGKRNERREKQRDNVGRWEGKKYALAWDIQYVNHALSVCTSTRTLPLFSDRGAADRQADTHDGISSFSPLHCLPAMGSTREKQGR
jgi:hypothetical protein